MSEIVIDLPSKLHAIDLCGPYDMHLRRIEEAFYLRMRIVDHRLVLSGDAAHLDQATLVIMEMIDRLSSDRTLSAHDLDQAISLAIQNNLAKSASNDTIITTASGRPIRAKTLGQAAYVTAVSSNTMTFVIGPAGTGKTYLAMALAVAALMKNHIRRIVLVRPVVEAGESLGFLPGTVEEKVNPYVRPLYDALFDLLSYDQAHALIESGAVEIAPLAFMRGRTLSESYVILDEAQNTTAEQMKMFVTRLGEGSKFIITGDSTQRDAHKGASGLAEAQRILRGIDDIAFVHLSGKDVVRNRLVSKIVKAYNADDKRRINRKHSPHDR